MSQNVEETLNLSCLKSASTDLDSKNEKLVSQIVDQSDPKNLTALIQEFNLNHTKKQIVRSAMFDQLLDQLTSQMQDRITKRGDQFSNKDLLDYVNSIGNQMDKVQKETTQVEINPIIQFNQQNNIAVVDQGLDRESRERVINAINLLKKNLEKVALESQIQENTSVYIDNNEINSYDSEEVINDFEDEAKDESSLDNLFSEEDDDL